MEASAGGERELAPLSGDLQPLLYGVALAIVLTLLLRETGPKARRPRHPRRKPWACPPNELRTEDSMSTLIMEPKHTSADEKRGRIQARPVDEGNQRPQLHPAQLLRPITGTRVSSPGRPSGRTAIWKKLTDLFVEERKKGVLDVSQIPSSITAHEPATSTRKTRSSSACRPMRR